MKLQCPECQKQGQLVVFEHDAAVVARRALSLHRFKLHGIRSQKAQAEADRKARLAAGEVPPVSPVTKRAVKTMEDIGLEPPPKSNRKERARWFKERWRILNHDRVVAQRQRYKVRRNERRAKGLTVIEAKHREQLQSSAWWTVDEQPIPIPLPHCPVCGAKFIAVKPK